MVTEVALFSFDTSRIDIYGHKNLCELECLDADLALLSENPIEFQIFSNLRTVVCVWDALWTLNMQNAVAGLNWLKTKPCYCKGVTG